MDETAQDERRRNETGTATEDDAAAVAALLGEGRGGLFFLHVRGRSMEPLVPDGSLVAVKPAVVPRRGDIVVMLTGDIESSADGVTNEGRPLQAVCHRVLSMRWDGEELVSLTTAGDRACRTESWVRPQEGALLGKVMAVRTPDGRWWRPWEAMSGALPAALKWYRVWTWYPRALLRRAISRLLRTAGSTAGKERS